MEFKIKSIDLESKSKFKYPNATFKYKLSNGAVIFLSLIIYIQYKKTVQNEKGESDRVEYGTLIQSFNCEVLDI